MGNSSNIQSVVRRLRGMLALFALLALFLTPFHASALAELPSPTSPAHGAPHDHGAPGEADHDGLPDVFGCHAANASCSGYAWVESGMLERAWRDHSASEFDIDTESIAQSADPDRDLRPPIDPS